MNERIKELLELSTYTHITGLGEWEEVEQEKFARLILKECLSYMDDSFGDIDYVKFMIKRNFGVE